MAQDPGGSEVAVRCGWPIKTSINNINCWPTPGRNHLPRSKGTVEAGGDDVLRLINTHVMLRMDDGGGGDGGGGGSGGDGGSRCW